MNDGCLLESLRKYIGQTITIFTTSGGYSGNGFTGVLVVVNESYVKLITSIGSAPNCPVGSSCNWAGQRHNSCNNSMGSVTEIPISKIASFTHSTV